MVDSIPPAEHLALTLRFFSPAVLIALVYMSGVTSQPLLFILYALAECAQYTKSSNRLYIAQEWRVCID